jgi:uncharacterized protein YndB with AHSA1/START domain
MHKRTLRHEVTIHALTTKLWRVLTSSEYTEQFLFDGQFVSDWTKGSPICSPVANQKTERGLVKDVVPGIALEFTLFSLADVSDAPVDLSYQLVPEQGGIMLILAVNIAFDTDSLYKLMDEQCKMMLQKIKWLAEYL